MMYPETRINDKGVQLEVLAQAAKKPGQSENF